MIPKLTLQMDPLGIRGSTTFKSLIRDPIFYCTLGFYGKKYVTLVFNIFFRITEDGDVIEQNAALNSIPNSEKQGAYINEEFWKEVETTTIKSLFLGNA